MPMQYRRLGASGLKVSELSLGSWITYHNQVDVAAAKEMLAVAMDAGVNFFDNAEVYAQGQSEVVMGEAIKALKWPRLHYVVSTKFFWGLGRDSGNPVNRIDTLNRKYLMQAIDGSLKRMQLDCIDLVYCHRPDPHTPIEETVWALHNIIEAGKALYWGTSEWSAAEIAMAHAVAERHHLHKPVTEQPQYNILHRARVDQGFRVARRAHPRTLATREGPIARSDRARARLYACPDVHRVVPRQSARLDGDHRRESPHAGRREHEGAARRGATHARRDGAYRRRHQRLIDMRDVSPHVAPRSHDSCKHETRHEARAASQR